MNRLIGLIIIASALVGAATAWRFPFSLGENQSANQVEPAPEATDNAPIGQTQVQPANVPPGQTAQAQNPNQRTAQAPQTVGQANTETAQPAPPAATEPVTALW